VSACNKKMSSDHQTSKPTPKNSLLSAAATGFAFEESAALLVPVTLQDEPSSGKISWRHYDTSKFIGD